jgi:diacylglycerol O-acyltransferase-1
LPSICEILTFSLSSVLVSWETVLVLGASNIRLIIENYMKYGLLIKLPHSYIPYQDYGLFVLAWVSVPISIVSAFLIEWLMAKIAIHIKSQKEDSRPKITSIEVLAGVFHCMHLLFLMIYPSYIVYTKIYHPMGKWQLLHISRIVFFSPSLLKLCSPHVLLLTFYFGVL